jgi:PAS domain S-box-containing protein
MNNMLDSLGHAPPVADADDIPDTCTVTSRPIFATDISAETLEAILDAVPDVVFFVKDTAGRYTHVNLTLMRRVGMKRREDVVGRSVRELYSAPLGDLYARQDQRVLRGETIENQLEVQVFPNRTLGWCVTHKRPLRKNGEICGIIGISRDLGQPDKKQPIYTRLRSILDYLQTHYAENLRVQFLAALGDLSVAQLERHFRRVFQITPQQMLTKLRIEAAMAMLCGNDSIAAIGQSCGFADQSAFARQFKGTVGMTPTVYRRIACSLGEGDRSREPLRPFSDHVASYENSASWLQL